MLKMLMKEWASKKDLRFTKIMIYETPKLRMRQYGFYMPKIVIWSAWIYHAFLILTIFFHQWYTKTQK